MEAPDECIKTYVCITYGMPAPKGRHIGHAGAIVSAFGESAQEKVEILKDAGVAIVPPPSTFGETVAKMVA